MWEFDLYTRIQFSRTVEVHDRRFHPHGIRDAPFGAAISGTADKIRKIVLPSQGVPNDGGAILAGDGRERPPLVNCEIAGLNGLILGRAQNRRA